MQLARAARGCQDFFVVGDSLDPERVNVYERWTDRAALRAFRSDGPDDEFSAMIISADVSEFDVVPIGRT